MKRVVISMVALLLFIAAGQAQGNARAERFERNQEQMDQFFKDIGVTAEQMKQIEAERTSMQKSMKELQGAGRTEENKNKMMALKEEHAAKMKTILNEEQYQKWDQKMKEQRQHQHHRISKPN